MDFTDTKQGALIVDGSNLFVYDWFGGDHHLYEILEDTTSIDFEAVSYMDSDSLRLAKASDISGKFKWILSGFQILSIIERIGEVWVAEESFEDLKSFILRFSDMRSDGSQADGGDHRRNHHSI